MADEADILIVGAGAAGLAAARELSALTRNVVVLEARDRIGGRILTHHETNSVAPIELGAEFIHGKAPEILNITERARLTIKQVPNFHWYSRNAVLSKSNEFWSKIEAAMAEMAERTGPDQSFAEFLDDYIRRHKVTEVGPMATLYVEGFHAARADKISVQGLVKTNEAAEEIDDEKQFRPVEGYLSIAQRLHDEAVKHGARFVFSTQVREVHRSAGSVVVNAEGGQEFRARRLLVTLPLGVLQRGDVKFVPPLSGKEQAARRLAVGHVVKVVLRFREPFWEDLTAPTTDDKDGQLKDFAFIHAPDELPPTWWTQLPVRAPLLVGWAGGSRAEHLFSETQDALRDRSIDALSHILAVPPSFVEDLLLDFYTHNWATDPLSLGAYSYIPVGGLNAQSELAAPVDNTIYFAGEATNTDGYHGTVHGAIATGQRAARQIEESF